MFYNARWNFVASLVAFSLVLTLGSLEAGAQVKPFKVVGAGIAAKGLPTTVNTPAPQWAKGHATDLGKYYAAGNFQLLSLDPPTLTGTFSSAPDVVFTAANGDKLVFTYGVVSNGAKQAGQVTLTPVGKTPQGAPIVTARFVAEFNPVVGSSTGRFAKVTAGSFIMVAQTEPFVFGASDPVGYKWKGAGTLTYGK
jgi:hypothetical protein